MCSLLINAGCTPPAEDTDKLVVPPEEEKPKVVEEEKPKVVEEEKPKVVEEEKPKAVEEEKPATRLTLKFTPDDSTTYKLISEAVRSIKWEGLFPNDTAFKGGQTSTRSELTFTQQIQSVDEKGNAVAKITIKSLNLVSVVRDNPVLDFDSSREKDKDNPMAKLIGQSYTIEITPAGQLSKIIDANQAQTAVGGSTSADKTAAALVSKEVIRDRHSIPAMPPPDKSQLQAGDNWNSVKTFSFGLMGSKSYERIYTLKEIKETDNHKIATVEMKAVPTTEGADQLHKEQAIGDFSKMFENTETYTGELMLNMTAGKVEKCLEKLESEWIAIDPSAAQTEEKEPAVLKMIAIRLYNLEKMD
jgi:hypothetical protein